MATSLVFFNNLFWCSSSLGWFWRAVFAETRSVALLEMLSHDSQRPLPPPVDFVPIFYSQFRLRLPNIQTKSNDLLEVEVRREFTISSVARRFPKKVDGRMPDSAQSHR
jgi:hypothetical protein